MEISKNTLMWIVIAVLFVLALYLTFKAGNLATAQTAASTATTSAKTISASSSASYGGMVGGC